MGKALLNTQSKGLLAISAIAIIALACISQDIDGQILALSIVAIAGLAGYEIQKTLGSDS